ncbi:MAG: hypothetical protein K0U59_01475 [Gammaproteobacteria bacterium]|nr:hypothetical protein [Gammaproteobacteria bacterium]
MKQQTANHQEEKNKVYNQIGRLKVQVDWIYPRASYYRKVRKTPASKFKLKLMRLLDEECMRPLFYAGANSANI